MLAAGGWHLKALKIVGIVFGSIVVLVLIVVGVIWLLMSRTSSIAAQVTPVASSPEAAQRLDAKWQDFRSTVSQVGAGTEVSVTITQEEMNSKINEELKSVTLPAGLAVENLNVNLTDGKILISANVNYSVFSGKAGMEATVETVDGQTSIVVKDVDMGALPIPQSLKDQLAGLIPENGIINISDLPFDISSVKIVNGQMVVDGYTQ